ncbi:hypothetical protein GG344DRAFT_69138 [Lentinula edodes]|nr:hypothetical protein GG344DRAFT_69138 [Lentinula edodes]
MYMTPLVLLAWLGLLFVLLRPVLLSVPAMQDTGSLTLIHEHTSRVYLCTVRGAGVVRGGGRWWWWKVVEGGVVVEGYGGREVGRYGRGVGHISALPEMSVEVAVEVEDYGGLRRFTEGYRDLRRFTEDYRGGGKQGRKEGRKE